MTLHPDPEPGIIRRVKGRTGGRGYAKFGNIKVASPEGEFDSKAEFHRWGVLKLMVLAGEIYNLRRQVRIPLEVDGKRLGVYVADFVYDTFPVPNAENSPLLSSYAVVEDTKGVRTALFKWKSRHFEAQYGFRIRETKA